MARVSVTAWDLLAETARLAGTQPWRVLLAVALFTGLSIASRFVAPGGVELGLILWAAMLLCQYDLTRALLAGLGRMPEGAWVGRLWPMAGLCLLSEFGIMFGFGFLVIPGVVLAVRWLLAGPILLAEESGITAALAQSWAETSANFGLLLPALAALFGPFLVVAVLGRLLAGAESPALDVTANLLAYAGTVASWICAVAAYRMSGRSPAKLAKLFT